MTHDFPYPSAGLVFSPFVRLSRLVFDLVRSFYASSRFSFSILDALSFLPYTSPPFLSPMPCVRSLIILVRFFSAVKTSTFFCVAVDSPTTPLLLVLRAHLERSSLLLLIEDYVKCLFPEEAISRPFDLVFSSTSLASSFCHVPPPMSGLPPFPLLARLR